MKALVVYESLWGNTAVIARAIAEGIGPDAEAVTTRAATDEALSGAELIVAGAPLLGFALPTDDILESIRVNPGQAPSPPDVSKPSMRAWLERIPLGTACCAGFETRIWWSPGSAAGSIIRGFERRGYRPVEGPGRFIVTGRYGPLKAGEIDRARDWGARVARAASRGE